MNSCVISERASYKLGYGSCLLILLIIKYKISFASAMIGAALGHKNTYLVRRHTACNVLPGSVLVSVTALMNGNMIDLSIPLENKTRILG